MGIIIPSHFPGMGLLGLRPGASLSLGLTMGSHSLGGVAVAGAGILSAEAQTNLTTAASFSFAVPATLLDDDVAVLITFKSDDLNTAYPGETFVLLEAQGGSSGSPDRGISISTKVITDAEAEIAAGPWTFTSLSSHAGCAFLYVIRGANTAAVVNGHLIGNTGSTIQPLSMNALTTTTDGCVVIQSSAGAKVNTLGHEITAASATYVDGFLSSGAAALANSVFGGAASYTQPSAGAIVANELWTHSNANGLYSSMIAVVAINML